MTSSRFDQFSRALAAQSSRRGILKVLGALFAGSALAQLGARKQPAEAQSGCVGAGGSCAGGPCCPGTVCGPSGTCIQCRPPSTQVASACYTFCNRVFGQGSTASQQCAAQAKCGQGPCFACGPGAPAGHPDVCQGACCPASTPSCCVGVCVALNTTTNCGACGNACGNNQACCNGVCTNLGTSTNCTACGQACAAGTSCCQAQGGCRT